MQGLVNRVINTRIKRLLFQVMGATRKTTGEKKAGRSGEPETGNNEYRNDVLSLHRTWAGNTVTVASAL
jgi:hypothetical protein